MSGSPRRRSSTAASGARGGVLSARAAVGTQLASRIIPCPSVTTTFALAERASSRNASIRGAVIQAGLLGLLALVRLDGSSRARASWMGDKTFRGGVIEGQAAAAVGRQEVTMGKRRHRRARIEGAVMSIRGLDPTDLTLVHGRLILGTDGLYFIHGWDASRPIPRGGLAGQLIVAIANAASIKATSTLQREAARQLAAIRRLPPNNRSRACRARSTCHGRTSTAPRGGGLRVSRSPPPPRGPSIGSRCPQRRDGS